MWFSKKPNPVQEIRAKYMKQEVLKILKENDNPMTPGQLKDRTGYTVDEVRDLVRDLYDTGELALSPSWKVYRVL